MKTSLHWLADYLPGPVDRDAAADALTNGGLPTENFEQKGDDWVIDVEVTSNRSDCLSHVGVARELSALLGRDFREVVPAARESASAAQATVTVKIDAPDLCPHYTARVIRNVKVGPSPAWMVRRLEAIGLRSINNVVDVTNYVMFELGQPLHAFDFDRIAGRQIIVRRSVAGEKLTAIDGRERPLVPGMLVIADADRPVALAGVMGGRDSEVSDSTTSVLLESARFDPLSVRKTARTLAMGTDSSYRFERGLDPLLPEKASRRAAQFILETAGGELLAGMVEAGASGYQPKVLTLRLSKLRQVLGVELPVDLVIRALRQDHLNPVLRDDRVECAIPSYRLDLNIEVDLVEEVARIAGYAKVPTRDEVSIRLTKPPTSAAAMETIRSTLVAGGYFESITFSFVSDLLSRDFVPPAASSADPLVRAEHAVRKADANLRPSILPGLLESVRHNESAGVADPKLFEIGSIFFNDSAGSSVERRQVAMAGGTDLAEIRGVVETLLKTLNPTREIKIVPQPFPGFARGAAGRVEWDGKPVGEIGQIDRTIADKLSLREPPVAAQLDLQPLLDGVQAVPKLSPLPKFPAVRRDVSLVVPESARYEAVASLVAAQKLADLEDVQYVTTYRGKPLDKGQKSVTITLVFRSAKETLRSEAVDAAMTSFISAAQAIGWSQRA